VLAAAWSFMRAVPERLQPGDLADALTWAAGAAARQGRDHAALAVRILAWAIRISEAPEARNDARAGESVTARFAEALIGLVRSGNIHEQGMPLEELGAQLTASPAFRRAAGRKILEEAAVEDIGDLTFSTPACLFPLEDAAPPRQGRLRRGLRSLRDSGPDDHSPGIRHLQNDGTRLGRSNG
jgi:hypothetical protein